MNEEKKLTFDQRVEKVVNLFRTKAEKIDLKADPLNAIGETYERRGYNAARLYLCSLIEKEEKETRKESLETLLAAMDKVQEEVEKDPPLPPVIVAFAIRKLNAIKICPERTKEAVT